MKEIEGQKVLFHMVVDLDKFGLTEAQAQDMDVAEEYAIVEIMTQYCGLMVYGLYKGEWIANPHCRLLIRELLERIQKEETQ